MKKILLIVMLIVCGMILAEDDQYADYVLKAAYDSELAKNEQLNIEIKNIHASICKKIGFCDQDNLDFIGNFEAYIDNRRQQDHDQREKAHEEIVKDSKDQQKRVDDLKKENKRLTEFLDEMCNLTGYCKDLLQEDGTYLYGENFINIVNNIKEEDCVSIEDKSSIEEKNKTIRALQVNLDQRKRMSSLQVLVEELSENPWKAVIGITGILSTVAGYVWYKMKKKDQEKI